MTPQRDDFSPEEEAFYHHRRLAEDFLADADQRYQEHVLDQGAIALASVHLQLAGTYQPWVRIV